MCMIEYTYSSNSEIREILTYVMCIYVYVSMCVCVCVHTCIYSDILKILRNLKTIESSQRLLNSNSYVCSHASTFTLLNSWKLYFFKYVRERNYYCACWTIRTCVRMCACTCIRSGEDAFDTLISAKEPVIIRFFCGKWHAKMTGILRIVATLYLYHPEKFKKKKNFTAPATTTDFMCVHTCIYVSSQLSIPKRNSRFFL